MMKNIAFAFVAAFLLSANAMAAIKIDAKQARNMDDVNSLGVIYINHNVAHESEAVNQIDRIADARGARYFHLVTLQEPGSNGNMHVSAEIYR